MNISHLLVQLTISALVLASVWTAGQHKIIAWPLLIAGQSIFLGYALVTQQAGFWPLNVGMVLIGIRNWILWRRQKHAEPVT